MKFITLTVIIFVCFSLSVLSTPKENRVPKAKKFITLSELQKRANRLMQKEAECPTPFLIIRNYRFTPSICDSLYKDLLQKGIRPSKSYSKVPYDFLIDSVLTNRMRQYIYPNVKYEGVGGIRLSRYYYLFEKKEYVEDVMFYYYYNGKYYYSDGHNKYYAYNSHILEGVLKSNFEHYFLLPTLDLGAIFGVRYGKIYVFTRYLQNGEYCPYYWTPIEQYRELFVKYIFPKEEYESIYKSPCIDLRKE